MASGKGHTEPEAGSAYPADPRERRRSGRIVHDDLGNARLEWVDVPPDPSHPRPKLALEEPEPVYRPEHGYDPYSKTARDPTRHPPAEPGERTTRDLRKLSEWIKQMRRLAEQKRAESDEGDKPR